jgi:hypothetical protein
MTEVDALLDQYDAGALSLSRPELLGRISHLDYKPVVATGMHPHGCSDFPQSGTLEEVEAATVAGRLTDDEFEEIILEAIGRQPELHDAD